MSANTSMKLLRTSASTPAPALKVGGVTPFSATDYPGQIAAVVFVQGCPWRCSYCHNPHLQARLKSSPVRFSDVLGLLGRRVGLIDAVVFSGGEPTLDPALAGAIAAVRELGFKVGLHTACLYPARLQEVLPLLDWVGFDIKGPFARYQAITGAPDSGSAARTCAEMILASGVAHECRTTIHPSLHDERELVGLAATLAGMGVRDYALQVFQPPRGGTSTLAPVAAGSFPGAEARHRIAAHFPRFTLRDAA